jgi:hypothetical protein
MAANSIGKIESLLSSWSRVLNELIMLVLFNDFPKLLTEIIITLSGPSSSTLSWLLPESLMHVWHLISSASQDPDGHDKSHSIGGEEPVGLVGERCSKLLQE